MEEIKIINQQKVLGKDFKVYGDFESPLFLAKDVAEWIDHSDASKMCNSVDEDEKVTNIVRTLGGNQSALFLTENGLYEVLMQSRKPIAKAFKKEVKEILKAIRKTGGYIPISETDTEQEILAKAYMISMKTIEEQKNRITLIQEQNIQLTTTVAVQEQQICELQPKASYYDTILNCKDLLSIGKIAKDYGWSATKMNKHLHEKGVQYRQGDIWLLYQKYAEKGYTSTKTHDYNGNDGQQHSRVHTYWTQKGRLFIYDLLKSDGVLPVVEREKSA